MLDEILVMAFTCLIFILCWVIIIGLPPQLFSPVYDDDDTEVICQINTLLCFIVLFRTVKIHQDLHNKIVLHLPHLTTTY